MSSVSIPFGHGKVLPSNKSLPLPKPHFSHRPSTNSLFIHNLNAQSPTDSKNISRSVQGHSGPLPPAIRAVITPTTHEAGGWILALNHDEQTIAKPHRGFRKISPLRFTEVCDLNFWPFVGQLEVERFYVCFCVYIVFCLRVRGGVRRGMRRW